MPSKDGGGWGGGGGGTKIQGTAGRFHGNPVRRNQRGKWSSTSAVTMKELQGDT